LRRPYASHSILEGLRTAPGKFYRGSEAEGRTPHPPASQAPSPQGEGEAAILKIFFQIVLAFLKKRDIIALALEKGEC
jgi:hypothetical protein